MATEETNNSYPTMEEAEDKKPEGEGEQEQPKEELQPDDTDANADKSDDNSDADKDGEDKESEEFEPYEIEPAEGADPDLVSEFSEFANELKIPKDKAEEFVNKFVEKQQEKVQNEIDGWLEEAKADETIGGKKFEENRKLAEKAVSRFGGEDFEKFLDQTKLGDHKEFIKVFSKIGAALKRPNASAGEGPDAGETENKGLAGIYTSMANK